MVDVRRDILPSSVRGVVLSSRRYDSSVVDADYLVIAEVVTTDMYTNAVCEIAPSWEPSAQGARTI